MSEGKEPTEESLKEREDYKEFQCQYPHIQSKDIQCTKEATHILRLITIPSNPEQAKLIYTRICVCEDHAEYLCCGSPFRWENLPSAEVKEEYHCFEDFRKEAKQ